MQSNMFKDGEIRTFAILKPPTVWVGQLHVVSLSVFFWWDRVVLTLSYDGTSGSDNREIKWYK